MPSENNGYESSLIGLAKFYGNYVDEKNTQFSSEAWDHMIDAETYEMISVVSKIDAGLPEQIRDWQGRKCYELLQGRTSPCENCYISKLSRDSIYTFIENNEVTGKRVFIESILVDHNGRPAVMEKVIDISDKSYRNKVVHEYMNNQNLMNTVLRMLMEESYITRNFENVCREICQFFDADRALITEYCSGKLNTTWSRIPQPFTQVCTELSDEAIKNITDAIETVNYIWVPDVPNAEKLEKNLREYWSSRGIRSILLIPMSYNGSFIGTVSLHNIRTRFNAIDTLKLLGMTVAKCIHTYIAESRAEKQLYSDPLTGALNLSGLKRKSYELFRDYPENKYYFCVMDIRYFGGINRRYGFELGDSILIKTAQQLDKYMDKDEAFCRISADVFCFIAKYPGEEAVRRRFAKFAESMQCFTELSDEDHIIEYQCGAYVIEEDCSVASAIDRANLARLSLRDETGSSVAFFSQELLERSKRETSLLQDFRPALAHGELSVYFQPQCSYSSGRTVGAEALVRWKSSKHGNVSPADFIPLLERHGLVHELDRFVWEEVCRYQQKWTSQGIECPVSVNLSRHDVLYNNICEELCALLDKYGIPKRLIPLEITETAYIKDSEEIINAVNKLKEAGFTVEMDDFGSGYSSLNALKDISVDLLKLDMKFLDMGDKTGKGGSILSCIVRMTRWLNLSVLAEGVETKEQAEYLKNIGCDLMQGFYFARPMPADEFEKMLMTGGASDVRSKEESAVHPDKFIEAIMSNPTLFNNIGAAAIAEESGSNVEVIMFNDSFLDILKMTREEYIPYMKDTKKFAESMLVGGSSLDSYTDSARGMRIRKCRIKNKNGDIRDVRIYSRVMLESEGRSIVLICVDDFTELVKHG